MKDIIRMVSPAHPNAILRVIPGHFITSHSHINYYVDTTFTTARESESRAIASLLARNYSSDTIVDSIVCMDGCSVIGAYMAEELTKSGIISMNSHKTIYIVRPEVRDGQVIFRDNQQPMVKNKNCLLIATKATTGESISNAARNIEHYGGRLVGVSAIFSNISKVMGLPVHSIFDQRDLPDYASYEPSDCPMCKNREKVDALVNSYGYSEL